jgi:hypothetical protein
VSELKLAIAGELGSGKTTLANYIEKEYHMTPFAFADELKKGFHYAYPHIPKDPKPRRGYQLYGQLMRCVYGEDYWINICLDEIDRCRKAAIGYNFREADPNFAPLITDARQPNEFERLKKEGYKIIKVIAPQELRVKRAIERGDNFTEADLNHESEIHISQMDADFTIFNEGSLEELYASFDRTLEYIRYGGTI